MSKEKLEQIRQLLGFSEPLSSSTNPQEDSFVPPLESMKATSDNVPFDSELNQDFEDHFTQHTFASHPLSKFALVSSVSAVVVVILVIFYSLMQSSQEPSFPANVPESEENIEIFGGEDIAEKREMDDLKAKLALSQQKVYSKSSPSPKSLQKIPPVEKKPISPVVRSPKPPPKHVPPQPKPVVTRQPIARRAILNQKPVAKKVKVNPQQRWNELSQIGSYKSQGSAEELPLIANKTESTLTPHQNLIASNQLMIQKGAFLPIQKAIAFLEGGIAIPTRSRNSQNLTVPIMLAEPLVDASGNEVVPQGAIIITEVSSNGSVIQLSPKTLSFEQGEQYYELNLTQGSLMITGNQGPIIARTKTVTETGEGLSLEQIAQLATVTGSLAGIEGARDVALIFNALGLSSRRNSSRNQGIQLYTVEAGTEVVVRIVRNLPFNLPSSTDENSGFKIPIQTASKSDEVDFDQEYVEEELDFEGIDNYYQEQELDFEYGE